MADPQAAGLILRFVGGGNRLALPAKWDKTGGDGLCSLRSKKARSACERLWARVRSLAFRNLRRRQMEHGRVTTP
jgi:hypothetical protein